MKKRLNFVQILRALGAILVVGFHGKNWLNQINHQKIGDFLFAYGSVGVSTFFAISGFMVFYTTQKLAFANENGFSISNYKTSLQFFLNRVLRFMPMYYLFTFLWILCFLHFSDYLHGKQLLRLIKSLLFIPDKNRPVLFLGWTLNYEVFFALFYAVILMFSKYKKEAFFIGIFIIIMLRFFDWKSDYMQMMANPKFNYFFLGAIWAMIASNTKTIQFFQQKNNTKTWAIIVFSIAIIVVFMLYYFKIYVPKSSYETLLIVGLFIIMFFIWDFYDFNIKIPDFLITLGDISFMVYLFHPFVLMSFEKLFPTHFQFPVWQQVALFAAQFILIISISWLLYKYVEKKLIFKVQL